MEILERKINLIKYFINMNNEKLLTNIEKLIYANENLEYTSFSPMSIKEIKNKIEISMKD